MTQVMTVVLMTQVWENSKIDNISEDCKIKRLEYLQSSSERKARIYEVSFAAAYKEYLKENSK